VLFTKYILFGKAILRNSRLVHCAGGRSGVQIPDRPNLTQSCKRFATASTSTQVAVLPRRYDVEMGTANLLHASA